MKFKSSLTLTIFWCIVFSLHTYGQKAVPLKACSGIFNGKWQLVQTFSKGGLHTVKKEEYDGVICFRSRHRYYEEVSYESNHWIIEGKWRFEKKTAILVLSQRHYTTGKLEDYPKDLTLHITLPDKNNWAGSSTDNGETLKVFYNRIIKQ